MSTARQTTSLQKRVTISLTIFGIAVLLAVGSNLVVELLTVRLAPSLVLTDDLRKSGYWRFTETPKGVLIQATAGRYKGWYLDADENVRFVRPADDYEGWLDSTERRVVLSEKVRGSSYWRPLEGLGSSVLQAAGKPFEGRCIDIGGFEPTLTRGEFTFSPNLLINGVTYPWHVQETDKGFTIQATWGGFTDWYLDADETIEPQHLWMRRRKLPSHDDKAAGYYPSSINTGALPTGRIRRTRARPATIDRSRDFYSGFEDNSGADPKSGP